MYTPTAEEIAQFKKEHGSIFLLSVDDKAAVYKAPSRKQLAYASKAGDKNPLGFAETILNECFVAGDQEIKNDDSYYIGAVSQINHLIEVKEAKLEKL